MTTTITLLFHSPCFDGIASAILTRQFLQSRYGWTSVPQHVTYDVRPTWASRRFLEPTAIVDFLFHQDAVFWADHHQSAFVDDVARRTYEGSANELRIYDPAAASCTGLLWRRLPSLAPSPIFSELVTWAEKIDSAHYESVDEALSFGAPALQINASLALASNGYCEFLVDALATKSLEEVARTDEVRKRVQRALELTSEGLERFRRSATLRDGIVVFDVDARAAMVSRYAPYRFFPTARYSVGVTRSEDGVKITAMRNPWREFPSVPLGMIFRNHGGGGHQRVGSVMLTEHKPEETAVLLETIISEIAEAEREAAAVVR